jgi:hypothetical protein
MYSPNGEEPEWVELFNNSESIAFTDSLRIADPVRDYTFYINNLLPKSYCVLVSDTNLLKSYRSVPESALLLSTKLPGLNNDKDSIRLLNLNNQEIDFFIYKGTWAKKGFSLERTSPSFSADNSESLKQSIAPDSATCGRLNSVSGSVPDTLPEKDFVEIAPNPFSPNAMNGKNICNIKLEFSAEYISLKIICYDMNGVKVRTIADNPEKLVPGKYSFTWDGMNEMGYPVQPGIYPLFIEYKHESGNKIFSHKKLLVVGT